MADEAPPDWAKDDEAPDWAKEEAPAPAPVPAAAAAPAPAEPGTLSKLGTAAMNIGSKIAHPFFDPHDIVEAGKSALSDVWEGEKRRAAEAEKNPSSVATNWLGAGRDVAGAALKTAEPVLEPAQKIMNAVSAPITTVMSAAAPYAAKGILAAVPEGSKNPNPTFPSFKEVYGELDPWVQTGLGLAFPEGKLPAGAPLRNPNPVVRPVPPPPERPPFGLTLSKGEETGDLAIRGKENAARRGEYGPEAQARVQAFDQQREGQFADVGKDVPDHLDAADVVKKHITDTAIDQAVSDTQRSKRLNDERDKISSGFGNGKIIAQSPQEAADVIGASVTRAEEEARAARDAAYDVHNNANGMYEPKVFSNVGKDVRSSLNKGEPVALDSKRTSVALSAIRDLDQELGAPARAALDPAVKSFPPFTPQRIEGVRKRLVAFSRQANATARATGDFSDVRAMGRVTDAFDDIVNRALRNPKMFSGADGVAIADNIENARALHSELRSTFSGNDPVGRAMQGIVGRGDQSTSSLGIRKQLFGNGENQVQMGRRMIKVFGEDSPEVAAMKQGLLADATETVGPQGRVKLPPEQQAENINELLQGNRREIGQTYFNPNDQAKLRAHADRLQRAVAPPTAKTDIVSRELEKVAGLGGQGYDAHQMSDMLYGRSGVGDNPTGVKMAEHVKNTYGNTSEPFSAIKGGQVDRLLSGTPAEVVKKIDAHLDGNGRPMADLLYTPQEEEVLRAYLDVLNKMVMPKGQYFPSAPPIIHALNKLSGKIGAVIGAAMARFLFPLAPPIITEAAGAGMVHAAARSGQMWRARWIAKQLPLVGEAYDKWQRAVYMAQRGRPYAPFAAAATASFARSLKPLGINLATIASSLMNEGAKTGNAKRQEQNGPGGENKNNNQTEIPQFAHGGRVEHSEEGVSVRSAFSPQSIGGKQAPDGQWYISDENRPGKYLRIVPRGRAAA